MGFPSGKESACNAGDLGLIPGSVTDLVRGVMEKNSSRMTRLSGLRKGGGTRINP